MSSDNQGDTPFDASQPADSALSPPPDIAHDHTLPTDDPSAGTPIVLPEDGSTDDPAIALSASIALDAAIAAEGAERSRRITRGLALWFAMLAVFGVGGLVLHQEELAAFAAAAGLFVASQAADLDRQWRTVHVLVAWVTPITGVAAFVMLGVMFATQGAGGRFGPLLAGYCFASALASALTLYPPFAGFVARALFRTRATSHTLRLAARVVLLGLLFTLPGWFAIRRLFDTMGDSVSSLVDPASLWIGLVGYVLLALAAVGFLLRRDLAAASTRLGLGRIALRHLPVVALGVAALYGLNAAADAIQQHSLHSLWLEDQRMNEAIGAKLGIGGTLALGLSAGVGEEITMRGALQPKLGILLTSLLFATLHVQYSWFGMIVILLLGMILGLIRSRTNTTVAMAVHSIYDILAVLSIDQPT